MIQKVETERYWHVADWEKDLKEYYEPLIKSQEIAQFKWEEIHNDYYYEVRRTYWDFRERGQDFTVEHPPGPKQLPPHIQADYSIELHTDEAADALDVIQNYKRYWPGTDMIIYGLVQGKNTVTTAYISLTNYESSDETQEEEESPQELVF